MSRHFKSEIENPGYHTPWSAINHLLLEDERFIVSYEGRQKCLLAPKRIATLSALVYILEENQITYEVVDQNTDIDYFSFSTQVLVSARALKKIKIIDSHVAEVEVGCDLHTLQITLYEWGYELGLEDWIWSNEKKSVAQALVSSVSSGLILRSYPMLDRLLGVDVIKSDGTLLKWGSNNQFSSGPHLHKLIWGCNHFDDILVKCYFKIDPLPSMRLSLNWSFFDKIEMWQQIKRLQQFSSSWERLDWVTPEQIHERSFILAQVSGTEEEMNLFKRECPNIDQASFEDKIRLIRNFLLQKGFSFIQMKDEKGVESLNYRWCHTLIDVNWDIIKL